MEPRKAIVPANSWLEREGEVTGRSIIPDLPSDPTFARLSYHFRGAVTLVAHVFLM